MRLADFWTEMTLRTKKYDLVNHPFFRAWIQGDLKDDEIGLFAREYYHHVAAFSDYLRIFESRLAHGQLRGYVSKVRREIDGENSRRESCKDLWINFVLAFERGESNFDLGMPGPEIARLIDNCTETVLCRSPAEILAALWGHESTVATLSREQSLCMPRRNCKSVDIAFKFFEARYLTALQYREIWCEQLNELLLMEPYRASFAIEAAELVAFVRWDTVSALERRARGTKTILY